MKTTDNTKQLGFGFMRLPKKTDVIDITLIEEMIDTFISNGYSYFDTAYIYNDSETILRKTLIERYPREAYKIGTKLPVYLIDGVSAMHEIFDTSISRLGIDHVDSYLLHGIDRMWSDVADNIGVWGFLEELRSDGRAKSVGFSFHGAPDELEYILQKHPEVDFVQLQINYIDWDDAKVQSRKLYEIARSHNKAIIVMEPVKGGLLAGDKSPVLDILKNANPDASTASWAIRFAAQWDGVMAVLSGMNSMEQMHDNIQTMKNFTPLNIEETAAINAAIERLNNISCIACTSCGYCINVCPKYIKIPQFIELFNETMVYNFDAKAQDMYALYTGDGHYASMCTHCRKCEERCPQKLEISEIMEKISSKFDKL